MIYTIDNPKLVKDYYSFKGRENFTGVVKDEGNHIAYYLNGKLYGYDDDYTNESWIRFVKLQLLK